MISLCAHVVTQELDGVSEMYYVKGVEQMDNLRKVIIALTTMTFVTLILVISAVAYTPQADPAAFYSSKCVTSHGKKAANKLDTTLADDQFVEAVV